MIEKITNRIKYKLQNNNLDFTADEILIIQENPSLIEDIIRMLASDISYWNKEIEDLFSYVNLDSIFSNIDENIKDNFFINFTEYEISKEDIPYISLDEIKKTYPISEKALKQIELMLERVYKGEKKVNAMHLTAGEIIELLDGRYYKELSKCIKISRFIELNIIKRVIDEFPFDRYDTPLFLVDSPLDLLEPVLDKLSPFVLNQLIIKHENNDKLIDAFINKLKKTRYNDATYVGLTYNLSYDDETINRISEICFNNNIIDFIETAYINNQYPKEEIITKVINYINTTDKLEIKAILPLLTSERVVNALIRNGWIKELIDYYILRPNEVNEIVDNINGLNPKYKKYLENFIFNNKIQYYPEILEAASNHPKLHIEIEQGTILNKDGEKFIIKYIKNNRLNLSPLQKENLSNLISIILKYNKSSELKDIIFSLNNKEQKQAFAKIIFDNNKDLLIDLIENTISIPTILIEDSPKEIIARPDILKAYITNDYALETLLNKIYHNETLECFYTQENVLLLKDYLSNKYKVDVERILIISEKIGPQIIKYIQNENIQQILRLEDNDFYKILNLFEKEVYSLRDLESAYDSLKQYEFSRKHPEIINIFNNIIIAIEKGNEVYLKDIDKYLDNRFFKSIKEEYELPEEFNELHPRDFLLFVIAKIKQNPKRDKYKDLFHKITDYYISKKREGYRKTYNLEKELNLEYNIVEKSAHKEFINYLLENSNNIKIDFNEEIVTLSYVIKTKLKNSGMEETLIEDCINYFNNVQNAVYTNDLNIIKQQRKTVLDIIEIIYNYNPKRITNDFKKDTIINTLILAGRIKRSYYIRERNINIYDLLSLLNITIIKETINNNEKVYTSLKQLLKKHKLLYLPDELKTLISNEYVNIDADYTNIIGFITYYKSILENKIKSSNFSLPEILIQADVYGSMSNVYSQILGKEDYNLIKSNPGPNVAVRTEKRMEKAISHTIKNYQRMEVAIPTFNEIINIDNKPIRVVVGNFTSPKTLTYGERTGSCMRIGGAGETLFDFILQNKNGFHIRFEDPFTGEFISRVSGFRNGNSVFLNQLRKSVNKEKYNDEEIIKYCEIASEKIIELSEESSYPIQNVFVHNSYAMCESPKKIAKWNTDIKKGLPYFYSDIDIEGIIMATKAKGNSYVPINLNGELPTYLPARETIIETDKAKEIQNMVIRIKSIKALLNGEQLEYLDEEIIDEIKYGVANQDWYIYVDNNNVIHKEIISIDKRAEIEFEEYLREVEKTYGGTTWHIA